jgi:hypothetical protein
MMSMSDADFANLGVADEDDRQSILFRLSASAGQSEQGARFIHQVNFTALIEATRFAAKGQNRKNKVRTSTLRAAAPQHCRSSNGDLVRRMR